MGRVTIETINGDSAGVKTITLPYTFYSVNHYSLVKGWEDTGSSASEGFSQRPAHFHKVSGSQFSMYVYKAKSGNATFGTNIIVVGR